MAVFVVQLQLGSVWMFVACVTCEMKSEVHAEPAPPFAGPGKAGLASHWTLQQES